MQKPVKNSSYMKFSNRQSVLNIIRKSPVSRAELSRRTGLTRAAITLIIDDLINDKVVIETDTKNSQYGRKPVMLEINPKRYYSVGLNISRYAYSIGILNIKGEVLIKKRNIAYKCENSNEVISIIAKAIQNVIHASEINDDEILGIGVTSPGPLDIYSGTILNPPNFDMWHNVPIVKELEQRTQKKVLLENISNARVIAEKSYGVGRGLESFMLIVVDEGIGAGIIIKNSLYHGVGGFGSEFGHTSINFDSRLCSCGNRGCVESYASIPNILEELYENDGGITSWKNVVDNAEKGDERCLRVIDREAFYLSSGIVNAMNLLELQAVVLAGDINYKPSMLLDRIREKTSAAFITRDLHNILILNSSITRNSEIIAPASIIIEDYFN